MKRTKSEESSELERETGELLTGPGVARRSQPKTPPKGCLRTATLRTGALRSVKISARPICEMASTEANRGKGELKGVGGSCKKLIEVSSQGYRELTGVDGRGGEVKRASVEFNLVSRDNLELSSSGRFNCNTMFFSNLGDFSRLHFRSFKFGDLAYFGGVTLREQITEVAKQAKAASRELAKLTTAEKNASLLAMAEALETNAVFIKEANAKDMAAGEANGLSSAMLDRLKLDDKRIAGMAQGFTGSGGLA